MVLIKILKNLLIYDFEILGSRSDGYFIMYSILDIDTLESTFVSENIERVNDGFSVTNFLETALMYNGKKIPEFIDFEFEIGFPLYICVATDAKMNMNDIVFIANADKIEQDKVQKGLDFIGSIMNDWNED